MPKWPAWILLGTMAMCAYPAVTASAPRTESAVAVERTVAPPVQPEAVAGREQRTRF